jgi:hypothetical protein
MAGVANGGDFDFSSIYSEIDPTEYFEMSQMSGEELAKMFGLDETMLKQMGFNNANAFKTAFDEGMDGWGQFHAE